MRLDLEIDLLKTFLAIVETGSYGRAGSRVGRTQSAVSMQMKRLEEIIGAPLFIRDGRVNRLSSKGERLLSYAHRIVSMNDEAVGLFSNYSLTGEVRLGTPDDYIDVFLPVVLSRFGRDYPGIQLHVECHSSDILYEKTRSGLIDVSVVTLQDHMKDTEVIRSEPLVWAGSLLHETHLRVPLPVALSHCGCIWRDLALSALSRDGRDYMISYESPSASALSPVILSGLAVGVLPLISLRTGMRRLGESDGFPSLGDFHIGLISSSGVRSDTVSVLWTYIHDFFSAPSPILSADDMAASDYFSAA